MQITMNSNTVNIAGGGIKCLWVALQFGALSRGLISPQYKDAASLKTLHWAITFNDIFKITYTTERG
jgi:hypothetical protein